MDDSLLDVPAPDDTQNSLVDPDSAAMHIRINYTSGAYIQTWYSKFDVTRNEYGEITLVEWTLAEVHPSAVGDVSSPIELGVANIESIWLMKSMRAHELYAESTPRI